MQDISRVCRGLLGALCMVTIAAAQELDEPVPPVAVAPEPFAEPPSELPPLPFDGKDATSPNPRAVGSAHINGSAVNGGHTATHTGHCHNCCSNPTCRNCRPGPVRRVKACLQRSHWGYADLFREKPLGACLRAHVNTQITNGMASRMVLYRYDFHDGILHEASKLNQHGRKRLGEMVRMLQWSVYPVVVEHTPAEPELAEARRSHVLTSLEKLGFPVPADWVIVGESEAAGLSGEEAVVVHRKMISSRSGQQRQGATAATTSPPGGAIPRQ